MRKFINYINILKVLGALMCIRIMIKFYKVPSKKLYDVPIRKTRNEDIDEKSLKELLDSAERLSFGRVACLERSIYLMRYLARKGVVASFRIGVRKYPFRAHAWVEVNGRPFCDTINHQRTVFRTLE